MAITPKAIISGIGASIFVLLVSACGADSTVAQAPTAVAKLKAQAAATLTPTAVPTATTIPTPTATPLPTPTLAPTATATPRNSDGNPDSPQVVVFLATIVDVTVGS